MTAAKSAGTTGQGARRFLVASSPCVFLDKYNPEQFEILGITGRQNTSGLRTKKYTPADTPKYNDLNARSVLVVNGEYQQVYARLLIRRKTSGGCAEL